MDRQQRVVPLLGGSKHTEKVEQWLSGVAGRVGAGRAGGRQLFNK